MNATMFKLPTSTTMRPNDPAVESSSIAKVPFHGPPLSVSRSLSPIPCSSSHYFLFAALRPLLSALSALFALQRCPETVHAPLCPSLPVALFCSFEQFACTILPNCHRQGCRQQASCVQPFAITHPLYPLTWLGTLEGAFPGRHSSAQLRACRDRARAKNAAHPRVGVIWKLATELPAVGTTKNEQMHAIPSP